MLQQLLSSAVSPSQTHTMPGKLRKGPRQKERGTHVRADAHHQMLLDFWASEAKPAGGRWQGLNRQVEGGETQTLTHVSQDGQQEAERALFAPANLVGQASRKTLLLDSWGEADIPSLLAPEPPRQGHCFFPSTMGISGGAPQAENRHVLRGGSS